MSGRRLHRHTIYRPYHRRRPDKSLQKNKRSSLKIHPSNPSIHPNRLTSFHRSRLFWTRLQSRRSVSRSRLAAASLHHPHRSLFSQHRCKLHQRSSRPPSVKSRSQTPHRGNGPNVAFLFVQGIRSKSAHQRRSQKRLYQKLIQSVRGKQLHRTRSGRCSKRATIVLPEQPPQLRKS